MAPFSFIHNFISYLVTEKRYSEHTCSSYRRDIEQFVEFAAITNESELAEVRPSLIRSWIVDLMDHDYSANSVNRKLSSLRTFFKWMLRLGMIDTNPMKIIKGPKASKRLPSFAKSSQLEESNLESLFSNDFDGIRDRLMLEMFYQTGIRSSELIGLKMNSVSGDQIKVLGKRQKERIIPISQELNRLIVEYQKQRSDIACECNNLFVLKTGKKLYPKFVYRKINSYLSSATDLEKKSPHVLRHTFATHMLNNGAGLEVLKELLGHANLTATQVYTHNSFAQLTNIYSQSHPRGHKT